MRRLVTPLALTLALLFLAAGGAVADTPPAPLESASLSWGFCACRCCP